MSAVETKQNTTKGAVFVVMNCTKVKETCQEVLVDKFRWKEAKVKTMRLYELYEAAGYHDYAVRTRDCATFLQF